MHDFAIVGLGIYGAALARELAKRGHSVVGFDQFTPPHQFGSSHGETRIYRSVPFNGPPYVELMNVSLQCLHEFQSETGQTFLVQTGGLDMGWTDGDRVQNTLKLCQANMLPYEFLTREEVSQRFGLFNLPENTSAVYQPSSGYLRAERLWDALLGQAKAFGAELHYNERVQSPSVLDDDENFVLRSFGNKTKVHVVSCCSGHGFKYALGLSKLLVDEFDNTTSPVDLSAFRRVL